MLNTTRPDSDYLLDAINKTVQEVLEPKNFFFLLITNRLKEQSVILSIEQIEHLKEQLASKNFSSIRLDLTESQYKTLESKDIEVKDVLDFSKFPPDDFIQKLEESIASAQDETISLIGENLSDTWIAQTTKTLREVSKFNSKFLKELDSIWGEELSMLEALVDISRNLGSQFNNKFRPEAAQKNDLVFEVLVRSHARSCQIGDEIVLLLRNGYADGAHARWRSLHEVAILAIFISQNDNDLANRYLVHKGVSDYKDAAFYQKYYKQLNYAPIPGQAYQDLKNNYDDLLERYGNDFANRYGWASDVLGNRNPNFSNIEECVNYDHDLTPKYVPVIMIVQPTGFG